MSQSCSCIAVCLILLGIHSSLRDEGVDSWRKKMESWEGAAWPRAIEGCRYPSCLPHSSASPPSEGPVFLTQDTLAPPGQKQAHSSVFCFPRLTCPSGLLQFFIAHSCMALLVSVAPLPMWTDGWGSCKVYLGGKCCVEQGLKLQHPPPASFLMMSSSLWPQEGAPGSLAALEPGQGGCGWTHQASQAA